MPLPVAHGLLGASVFAALQPRFSLTRDRKLLLICALPGISPDFDYGLNWLRVSGGGWHHGFTHSIVFAFFVGAVVSFIVGAFNARALKTFCAVVLSHAMLDFLFTESRGVALLWPFSNQRLKLMMPNPVDYHWNSVSLWEAMAGLLRISLIESAIFAPILVAIIFARNDFEKHSVRD